MDETTCVKLLQKHGIKPTSNRILVVKVLAEEEHPSSLSELECRLTSVDKSGIFRALTLFRDHHLVHTIEDGEGSIRYELCMCDNDEEDDDMHVHFYCESCHKLFCLYDTPIPPVTLPRGFSRSNANYVIKGICPECKKKKL
jgi:Fur family ferric uptake transcriptional regulator